MNPLLSIRLGLPVITLACVLITGSVWSMLDSSARGQRADRLMEAHGQMLSAQLAAMAVESVIADDRASLSGLAHRITSNPTITALAIEALDGQRLAGVGPALSDDPKTIFEAPVRFEDTVVARVRIVLDRSAFASPVGIIRLTAFVTLVLLGTLALLGARVLARRWSITLQSVTAELCRSIGKPVPDGPDIQSAETLLSGLAAEIQRAGTPAEPETTAVTQINVFNLPNLAPAPAQQALAQALRVAQQCAALYGGTASEHPTGAAIHWYAHDPAEVLNGLCAALLAWRRLEGAGADFRLGVHAGMTAGESSHGAPAPLAAIGANEVRQALTLSTLGRGGVAVSAPLIEIFDHPQDTVQCHPIAGGAWRALDGESRAPWLLTGLAPRYADLIDQQLSQFPANG